MGRLTFSSAAAFALIFSGLAAIPAQADTYPPCTISGTSANQTVNGTEGNDVICTGVGNYIVNALGGNDIIIVSGTGVETLNARSRNHISL